VESNYNLDQGFPVWTPQILVAPNINPYGGIGPNGGSVSGISQKDLKGVKINGNLRLDKLIGAKLEGVTTSGEPTLLHIAGAAVGTGANQDLLYFAVYAADGAGWTPLCGTGPTGDAIPALAVPGTWNHERGAYGGGKWHGNQHHFSFACRGSSIAKCMEAGYKPWTDPNSSRGNIKNRGEGNVTRANHLQACVRMIRADYCGDGTSHTVNGRTIEFWDSMGMHTKEQNNFTFEAAWTPDGVLAFDYPRVMDHRKGMPSCWYNVPWANSHMKDPSSNDIEYLRQQGHFLFSAYEEQLQLNSSSRYDDDD
ncbi:MAG: ADYC domain-containing protein, partial [Myxococcota bacterium]